MFVYTRRPSFVCTRLCTTVLRQVHCGGSTRTVVQRKASLTVTSLWIPASSAPLWPYQVTPDAPTPTMTQNTGHASSSESCYYATRCEC